MSGAATLHATCVAIEDQAVLLIGAAGVGKSDVALRLIELGATLVSDDQTLLTISDGVLLASPPQQIAGLIEVRHVGLMCDVPFTENVAVQLVVELLADAKGLERLPSQFFHSLLDQRVRALKLVAHEASTPIKIRMALQGQFLDV